MHAAPRAGSTAATTVRPFIAFALLALALYSLLAHWEQRGAEAPQFSMDPTQVSFDINVAHNKPASSLAEIPAHPAQPSTKPEPTPEPDKPAVSTYNSADYPRRVVAHFMLGNTYPYTDTDWIRTLHLAEKTSLDALVLNLGPEDWQMEQAKVAYKHAEAHVAAVTGDMRPLRLFISLDMNVLAHATREDATALIDKIAPLLNSPAALKRGKHPILSTFGGHDAKWGRNGWPGFIAELNGKVPDQVFFWPGFFISPDEVKADPLVGGSFNWNAAWPPGDHPMRYHDDQAFLDTGKPYMAAVSPCFFTHYGKTGQFAFDKNWIYRSDDLLYPGRWFDIMGHPDKKAPEMVQIISWNDYGESHNIGPVMGAEPGSTAWTHRMSHDALREMTGYFARRWRDSAAHVADQFTVWMWYRTHSKSVIVKNDPIGRPENADFARDYINLFIQVPRGVVDPRIEIHNGPRGVHGVHRDIALVSGDATETLVDFVPGHVNFVLKSKAGVHINGTGRPILTPDRVVMYNFNMWSGQWYAAADHVERPPPEPSHKEVQHSSSAVASAAQSKETLIKQGSAGKGGATHGHRPYMGPGKGKGQTAVGKPQHSSGNGGKTAVGTSEHGHGGKTAVGKRGPRRSEGGEQGEEDEEDEERGWKAWDDAEGNGEGGGEEHGAAEARGWKAWDDAVDSGEEGSGEAQNN